MTIKEIEKINKMDEDLHKLFIDFIKLEYTKLALVTSAKLYYDHHGLVSYKRFFEEAYRLCDACRKDFICSLINRMEIVPEMTIPAIDPNFEDKVEPFTLFAEMEDEAYKKLDEIAKKAYAVQDFKALSFILVKLDSSNDSNDHVACKALEAVKNNEDPYKVITKTANDFFV